VITTDGNINMFSLIQLCRLSGETAKIRQPVVHGAQYKPAQDINVYRLCKLQKTPSSCIRQSFLIHHSSSHHLLQNYYNYFDMHASCTCRSTTFSDGSGTHTPG